MNFASIATILIIVIPIIIFIIWISIPVKSNISKQEKQKQDEEQEERRIKEQEKRLRYEQEEKQKQEERHREEEQERLLKKEQKELEEKLIREQEKQKEYERRKKEEQEKLKKILDRQEKWKPNWRDFQKIILEQNITVLYHFTDRANLQSIYNNNGLYSWKYLKQNNIPIPYPGGDSLSRDLDIRYNLQNYVRLCFTKNHPMMYVAKQQGRLNDPVILEISSEVIFWNETKYSNMNATKTGHLQGETINDFLNIKFEIVKQNTHFDLAPENKKYYQAEVMIKKHIPLSAIKNIDTFIINTEIEDDLPF